MTLAQEAVKIPAAFNHKIRLGVEGRAETFEILNKKLNKLDKCLWFHCASLGEYEQGLPVFKALRTQFPSHKIVLTFFSPSGYEIRKNTEIADVVVYLPLDIKHNAKRFLDVVNPELTIFTKYDIWPNYLNELQRRHLKTILISAAFRPNQIYFKPYGRMMKNALKVFQHIFVQNEASKTLLNKHGFTKVSVAGDTRFDRVTQQLEQNNSLAFVEHFKNNNLCIVIGSAWPEDEAVLLDFINQAPVDKVKFIIAPHNINQAQIKTFTEKLNKKVVLFSKKDQQNLSDFEVLIIDTIGLLTKIYSYADIAYVGGAMGNTGLHNILEPAVFGVPILIGKHYEKFPEAYDMIAHGGVFSISNASELKQHFNLWIDNPEVRKKLGHLNRQFISDHQGAVHKIMDYITSHIENN